MERDTVSLQQTALSLGMWWQVLKGVQAWTINQRVIISEAWVVVQSLNCIRLCDPWTAACWASLTFTVSLTVLKLMSIESVMTFNPFILSCPLLLLISIFPSIRVFSNELAFHIRWPKYWSFGFSFSPSDECSGFSSFRIGWFDLFAVQETRKSLLQHTI